jgi:hypothetical protein
MLAFHGSSGNVEMWGYPWNHGSKISNILFTSSILPTVLKSSLSKAGAEEDLPHLILLMQHFSPGFWWLIQGQNLSRYGYRLARNEAATSEITPALSIRRTKLISNQPGLYDV